MGARGKTVPGTGENWIGQLWGLPYLLPSGRLSPRLLQSPCPVLELTCDAGKNALFLKWILTVQNFM